MGCCKVSVIIPVYNEEKYLADCLESVLSQSLQDIELICVNDGSDDSSGEIINNYAQSDLRIKALDYSTNHGLAFARNRGLEKAQGEYIFFLDSDDMMAPNALEELYTYAHNQALDILIFDMKQVFESENLDTFITCKDNVTGVYDDVYTGMDLFCFQRQNGEYDVSICKKLWKRVFLDKAGMRFYEGILHEDFLFDFQGMMHAEYVKYVPLEYYIYRRHMGTITLSHQPERRFFSYFVIYCEFLSYLHQLEGKASSLQTDCICRFIEEIYALLRKEYAQVRKPTKIFFRSAIHQMLYRIFLVEQGVRGIYYRPFNNNEIEVIRNAESVIIYGAGVVGVEVAGYLRKMGIIHVAFAVTKMASHMEHSMAGYQVRSLDYYLPVRETALVILAVSGQFREDMKKNLERLGFRYVLTLDYNG